MTTLRQLVWLAITMLISVLPLIAQAQAASVLAEPSLGAERAKLSALVEAARQAGLPEELLVEKVREGLAKRVPAARITQAVTLLHDRMQLAARLLGPTPQTAARAANADRQRAVRGLVDALNAGLTESDLASVMAQLGPSSRDPKVVAEVAVTLAELSERGFARASVVRATQVAWQRGGVRAMPSVIALAATLGPQVASRDAALEQSATQLSGPPGLNHAPGQQNNAAREPGPPHDDAFNQGQGRGRGNGKGPKS